MGVTTGLTNNPMEITQWINKIETHLSKLSVGNFDGTVLGTTALSRQAPQVTGLSLLPIPDAIVVGWNPVNIANLDFYEIHVADNVGFVAPEISRQRNLRFTFQSGDPDTEYYIRVRAKPLDGTYGDWSGALNTETGLVTVDHLGRGAATAITDNTIDLSGYPVLDPAPAPHVPAGPHEISAVYGNTVAKVEGGTILPFVRFDYEAACSYVLPDLADWPNCGIQAELQRTGETGDTVVTDLTTMDFGGTNFLIGKYDTTGVGAHVMSKVATLSLSSPEDPGEGVFTWSLKFYVVSDPPAFLRVQPLAINIEIAEFRS